ncbi:penicillin-binding protein 1A [Algihabitans albus]|uniref:penicillin-binding protein 1A n=1 Tax=Algihabitans albus TaxID=2164067 RepID=UPI000E5CBA59|nr:penicillin-binding protein 1A [Algihabitans albus]
MLKFLKITASLLLVGLLLGAGGVAFGIYHFSEGLPAHDQLADYEPPMVTRVHANDGRLLAEFATEKRVFVPFGAIPERVKAAFISAEDQNFYQHSGIDFVALLRAVVTNVRQIGSDRRPVGASTITQQVAKNFLLTNEVSIDRKVREAILSFRIEQTFSKQKILQLYMNEIYLGFGSYGVATAALNYFDKSLDELTTAEAAYLAALPKAPNNYHPTRRTEAAINRRNWVIARMLEDGAIGPEEAATARAEPLVIRQRRATQTAQADYFAEEVRRELAGVFGDDGVYEGGLSVRTTVDPRLQAIADRALRSGLVAYDRRHGYRGPVASIDAESEGWAERLEAVAQPAGAGTWQLAVVLALEAETARIGLADGSAGTIPMGELTWAREALENQRVGQQPRQPSDVLSIGDVVLIEPLPLEDGTEAPVPPQFGLRQIPAVQGGLVALDPHSGRMLAMSGGFSAEISEFNRAVQARRQPGSAFKPFVYLAALDHGFTPSSIVLDAPITMDQGPGLPKWKPANYTKEFYGPTTLRIGVEKSRNLMTVRLADAVGMPVIADYAKRLGIVDNLEEVLSMSLGAGETTALRMTAAYAMLVNGGKRIEPTMIDRVQDRFGQTLYKHDNRDCAGCTSQIWTGQAPPALPDTRAQVADPRSAYQMVSILEGAILRGTGVRAREIGKPLAGKTGTTNDYRDAWFVGFSPDLVAGVYVGFDEPRSLGNQEAGSRAALPIWKAFMEKALAEAPATPFRIPEGIRLMRVSHATGRPAGPGDSDVIWEAFKPGEEPQRDDPTQVLTGQAPGGAATGTPTAPAPQAPRTSGSGLY